MSTLTRWMSQDRDVSEVSEAPVDLHGVLKPLRPENAVLKQERDILKMSHAAPTVQAAWRTLSSSKEGSTKALRSGGTGRRG